MVTHILKVQTQVYLFIFLVINNYISFIEIKNINKNLPSPQNTTSYFVRQKI